MELKALSAKRDHALFQPLPTPLPADCSNPSPCSLSVSAQATFSDAELEQLRTAFGSGQGVVKIQNSCHNGCVDVVHGMYRVVLIRYAL